MATVRPATEGIFEVLLVAALLVYAQERQRTVTGNANIRHGKCHFTVVFQGILQLEEEILKRWRHNGKLFIASVLSAAETRDCSLFFSFIRCVALYTR